MKTLKTFLILGISSVVLFACKRDDLQPTSYTLQLELIKSQYKEIALNRAKQYNDSLIKFQNAATAFSSLPVVGRHNMAKESFKGLQKAFFGSMIYASDQGALASLFGDYSSLYAPNNNIEFIDYTSQYPNSGIVNDPNIGVDQVSLQIAEDAGGPYDRLFALQPIEFMLWGEDLFANSGGQRPHFDYSTAANFERRKAIMKSMVDVFTTRAKNLQNETNYRISVESESAKTFYKNLIGAMQYTLAVFLSKEVIERGRVNELEGYELSPFADETNQIILHVLKELRFCLTADQPNEVETGYFLLNLFNEMDEVSANRLMDVLDQLILSVSTSQTPFDQLIKSSAGKEILVSWEAKLNEISGLLWIFKNRIP